MRKPETSRAAIAAVLIAVLTAALAYGRFHEASAWFSGGWKVGLIVVSSVTGVIFGFGLYRRVAVWLCGAGQLNLADPGHRLMRLVRVGIFQRKVLRDRVAGSIHFAVSYSFGLLLLWYTIQSTGVDIRGIPSGVFDFVYSLLGVAALAALILRFRSGRRGLSASRNDARTPLRRRRDVAIISLLLLVAITYWVDHAAGGSIDGPPKSELTRFLHVLAIVSFLALIPYTKLMHVFTAPLSVFLAEHDTQRVVPLPFNLSTQSEEELAQRDGSFGLSDIGSLPLFRMISLDACTECGRCTAVCPATQSGSPLSPMNVVTKLRDWAVSGESPEIDGIFSRDELLSCTTCGRCVTECPVQIDHVGLITDLRRDLVYEGDMDAGHQRTMQRLSEVDNPYGQPAAARGGWALSEGFEEVADGQQYDYLYWLGCASSFDTRAQDVARTVHKLLKAAGCRVGTLASREKCTGDAARRIGDEGLFQKLALANIEAIRGVQFKAIVTHCPHCLNAIKNEYRLLGGDFEVRHHTEVLADLVASGAIELKRQLSERATYHDPCYLGRHNGVFDAPRALLDAIPSLDLVEMARSREKSACCGAGGGQMWLGEELGDKKINVIRVEDVLETGASTIVTGCQFCTVMLEEGVQLQNQDASIRVRDISEMIAEAADLA